MIAISKIRTISSLLNRGRTYFTLFRFHLPDLGEKIKQGRVKKLYVKQGDKVNEFQKLADVQSDKQFTQITSPYNAIIKKLYYREDQTCLVGDLFIQIDILDSKQLELPKIIQEIQTVQQSVQKEQVNHENSDILASATVKMLARQHKINLRHLKGTGRKGRILKDDIIYYVEDRLNEKKTQQNIIPKASPIQSPSKPIQKDTISKKTMTQNQKQLHKIIAYSNSIPHLYYQQTFDVTQIQQLISKLKQSKISLLSILIKTFTLAIQQYPIINSTYNVENPFHYKIHPNYNLLIPTFSDNGIVFNTLHNTQKLSIKQISSTISTLPSTSIADIKSTTICISNIGKLGTLAMNPLIYGEMVCHASIGSLRKIPMYASGKTIQRHVVDVTMGCDHRVLDGASVARFTSSWRDYSQKPTLAFLNMI